MAANDGSIVFRVDADDAAAQKKLDQLRRDIEKTTKAIESTNTKKSGIETQLQNARAEAEKTAQTLKELREQQAENDAVLSGRTGDVDIEEFNARKQAQEEIQFEIQQQEAAQKRQNAEVEQLEKKEQAVLDKLKEQTATLEAQRAAAGEAERAVAEQASSAMPQLRAVTDEVSKSLKKGFRNILRWGFGIRSAFILMRRLRSAIIEGVKAYAQSDPETKANIDGLKSSLASLKASWGAAFAPIFNIVAPALQKLIGWLQTAANYVQMFFAALSGKGTWKRAVQNQEALAGSLEGTGAAAKEAQKQLMGFDEINKLNDNESGGGSGGGPMQEFEDVEIDPQVISLLDKIKERMREIGILAGLVGAALLAWKLSPLLGLAFKTVFGVLTTIIGVVVFIKNAFDAWVNGVDWNNFIGMLEGAALIVLGLGIAFGTTGAAIGLLITGVAMLVIGIKDWIQTGKISNKTFALMETAILAIGVAIALLTGAWIPLVIAAIVGLVLAVVKNWDEIKKACKDAIDRIVDGFREFKNKLIRAFTEFGTEAKKSFADTWENIKRATENFKNSFIEKFNAIRDKAQEVVRKVKEFFSFKWEIPHIKLPHITVSWTDTSRSSIAKLLGITAIPRFGIQWYAKGGLVDGATLFGAGEAGKEAVVPLERHTEWIKMVADGIIDGLTSGNQLADYITGRAIPAIASGQIVPPRALSGGGMLTDADIDRLVSGITAAFSADGGNDSQPIKLYLDGRQIAETVTKHQRQMSYGRGV